MKSIKGLLDSIPTPVYTEIGEIIIGLTAAALILFLLYWIMVFFYGLWLKLCTYDVFAFYILRKRLSSEDIQRYWLAIFRRKPNFKEEQPKHYQKLLRSGAKWRLRNMKDAKTLARALETGEE